jgi:hypothetical protein
LPHGRHSRQFLTYPAREARVEIEEPHHYWPDGEPYDSYYVPIEMDHAPDVLKR